MVSHQVCTKKITQKYRVKKSKELKCYTRNNLIPTKKKKKVAKEYYRHKKSWEK